MKRITINDNGDIREVSVIRYIESKENKYLIYTFGEIEGELERIYITKIVDQDGLTGIKVPDEEWDAVKLLIQQIVKENRSNTPVSTPDLDENSVDNVRINDKRIIKLKAEIIPMLEANKTFVVENAEPINVVPPVIPEINVNPIVVPEEPKTEAPTEPVVPEESKVVVPTEPVVTEESKVEVPTEPAPLTAEVETPAEPEIPVAVPPIVEPKMEVKEEPKETEPTVKIETEVKEEDYKFKYEAEVENNKEISKKLEDLSKEISELKAKLEQIDEIIKGQ